MTEIDVEVINRKLAVLENYPAYVKAVRKFLKKLEGK